MRRTSIPGRLTSTLTAGSFLLVGSYPEIKMTSELAASSRGGCEDERESKYFESFTFAPADAPQRSCFCSDLFRSGYLNTTIPSDDNKSSSLILVSYALLIHAAS